MPDSNQFVSNPLLDGDTWHIRIKGTDDVLTIKNQSGIYGAISEFQFDGNTSYSTGELINHFKLSIPHMIGNTNIVQYTGQPVEELNRDVYNNFNHTIHADSDNSDLDLSHYTSVVEYRATAVMKPLLWAEASTSSIQPAATIPLPTRVPKTPLSCLAETAATTPLIRMVAAIPKSFSKKG